MSEFEERLAAVEAKLANLVVGDLPLKALMNKLEADWQPDAGVFLQPGSITEELIPWQIVRGVVDATSGTPSILAGTGFTITDNGLGDYTINFTPAFKSIPAVVLTPRKNTSGTNAEVRLQAATAATAAAARVQGLRLDTGGADDVEFHFIAIAPR